jgi:hypothetical protein
VGKEIDRVSDPRDSLWQEFEALGEEEIRRRLAARQYSVTKTHSANQWLEYRESLSSSVSNAQSLALAREANDLARSANATASEANTIARDSASSASLSAKAARRSNIIATAALIAAAISVAASIISMILHK